MEVKTFFGLGRHLRVLAPDLLAHHFTAGAGIPEVVVAGKARLQGGFPGTRIVAAVTEPARA